MELTRTHLPSFIHAMGTYGLTVASPAVEPSWRALRLSKQLLCPSIA